MFSAQYYQIAGNFLVLSTWISTYVDMNYCFQEATLKKRSKEREDLGVELYGIQQELARFQMMLERRHDDFSHKNQLRQREEQQLTEVRSLYKDTQLTFNKETKKGLAVGYVLSLLSIYSLFLCLHQSECLSVYNFICKTIKYNPYMCLFSLGETGW